MIKPGQVITICPGLWSTTNEEDVRMSGFFGVTSRRNCILDVFFGTDYHSHLGTRRGGVAA